MGGTVYPDGGDCFRDGIAYPHGLIVVGMALLTLMG